MIVQPMTPEITFTDAARAALTAAMADADGDALHLDVSASFAYDLYFGPLEGAEIAVDSGGLTVHLSPDSIARAHGMRVDYVETSQGGGFKIDNPNEPARVKQLSPTALKDMLDKGELAALFDVRTDAERTIAVIAGARHLDREGEKYIQTLDRSAPIGFHCHHGVRSLSAAEHYARLGFKNLYNLQGGIDGWSVMVDPSVRRY